MWISFQLMIITGCVTKKALDDCTNYIFRAAEFNTRNNVSAKERVKNMPRSHH